MFSIGQLSKQSNVKIPTIRYYEQMGLLAEPGRTEGNQRRYDKASLEKLKFVKHARDLGFSIEAILELISLQEQPNLTCQSVNNIAQSQLNEVKKKIQQLQALEAELKRLTEGCNGKGTLEDCYVLASLADHALCSTEHG